MQPEWIRDGWGSARAVPDPSGAVKLRGGRTEGVEAGSNIAVRWRRTGSLPPRRPCGRAAGGDAAETAVRAEIGVRRLWLTAGTVLIPGDLRGRRRRGGSDVAAATCSGHATGRGRQVSSPRLASTAVRSAPLDHGQRTRPVPVGLSATALPSARRACRPGRPPPEGREIVARRDPGLSRIPGARRPSSTPRSSQGPRHLRSGPSVRSVIDDGDGARGSVHHRGDPQSSLRQARLSLQVEPPPAFAPQAVHAPGTQWAPSAWERVESVAARQHQPLLACAQSWCLSAVTGSNPNGQSSQRSAVQSSPPAISQAGVSSAPTPPAPPGSRRTGRAALGFTLEVVPVAAAERAGERRALARAGVEARAGRDRLAGPGMGWQIFVGWRRAAAGGARRGPGRGLVRADRATHPAGERRAAAAIDVEAVGVHRRGAAQGVVRVRGNGEDGHPTSPLASASFCEAAPRASRTSSLPPQ